MSLFAEDMILFIENPKDFTPKLLELINKLHKVIEYKNKDTEILGTSIHKQQTIRNRN